MEKKPHKNTILSGANSQATELSSATGRRSWNVCWQCVCTQPAYNDKIHPVFFFYLLKSLLLSQIEPISVWRHTDGGTAHDSLIDRSNPQRVAGKRGAESAELINI